MTGVENVGVFIRVKVWLEPNIFSPIDTPTLSNLLILHTYPPMKMEQTMFRNVGI